MSTDHLSSSKGIKEQKLDFIIATEREIWDMVRPILKSRVEKYKEVFGEFDTTDMWLWHNISIGIEVAMATGDTVDVEGC